MFAALLMDYHFCILKVFPLGVKKKKQAPTQWAEMLDSQDCIFECQIMLFPHCYLKISIGKHHSSFKLEEQYTY